MFAEFLMEVVVEEQFGCRCATPVKTVKNDGCWVGKWREANSDRNESIHGRRLKTRLLPEPTEGRRGLSPAEKPAKMPEPSEAGGEEDNRST
jgi:hypothetical protein